MRPAPTTDLTIGELLDRRLVRSVFQPIVDLATRTVMGLEALARGPAGTTLEFPDRLFALSREAGRLGELDMLCFERALEGAIAAPVPPPLLFANGEPAVMGQPLSPRIMELFMSGPPFRTILEYTERALPAVPGSLLRLSGNIQLGGNGIALDDVGVDPMSLAFLPILEPEVIKLDMSLTRDPDTAHARTVAAVVRAEAARTGAVVIAEGIETEEHLTTARRLGAHWGQGWLFGRPGPIDQVRHFDPAAAAVTRAARPGFHQPAGTPFEIAAQRRPPVVRTPGDVETGLARLREITIGQACAVVTVSHPGLAGLLQGLAGPGRAVVLLDQPVVGEFVAAVVGPGFGYALCARDSRIVTVDDLPTAAAISRVLLSHTG
ncbi:EAL domain-containing protein [Actinoplanes sp. NPDC049802]|uniref:EAL domain-containing protein n=1 Tax=Actinoplanes sp. NPDC049802 TaxID=3154742 RepID=UPI0033F0F257